MIVLIGIVLDFNIHTGQGTDYAESTEASVSAKVVPMLRQSYLDCKYILYVDNWY